MTAIVEGVAPCILAVSEIGMGTIASTLALTLLAVGALADGDTGRQLSCTSSSENRGTAWLGRVHLLMNGTMFDFIGMKICVQSLFRASLLVAHVSNS